MAMTESLTVFCRWTEMRPNLHALRAEFHGLKIRRNGNRDDQNEADNQFRDRSPEPPERRSLTSTDAQIQATTGPKIAEN